MAELRVPTGSKNEPESSSSTPASRSASPAGHGHTLRRPASQGRLAKLLAPGRSRSSSTASQEASPVIAYAQSDDGDRNNSGRTTPEQRRRIGKAATTSLLASDAKYKKFVSAVDKNLQSFESVNEWADFISFLSRLLKTLQTQHPPYSEIPRKLIVSKRLSQCLNPALPSGVHQRALDVYAYIFSIIGVEGLKRDLSIWSSGLFPFFQYAATSVRPILVNIYETYYLPLGPDLRPATKALILALSPGLEEENGDFFDKVLALLNRFSATISPDFFLQNVFLILISNPSSRLSGLNYLGKVLLVLPDPAKSTLGIGLVIRGISVTLEDENVLVRRNGLDILLRLLPLDSEAFREAEQSDREHLMRAACAVTLHREVSLSRRVFIWLLGKDESPEKQQSYFRTYGLELLTGTLLAEMNTLRSATDLQEAQRPFKIFLSLLDKWEVGAALSEKLVIPALHAIRSGIPLVLQDMRAEMVDTAIAVYDAVEPIIIWRIIHLSYKEHFERPDSTVDLVDWLLFTLPQHDEEIRSLHVPVALEHILHSLISKPIPDQSRSRWSRTSSFLFRCIPTSTFQRAPPEPDASFVDESRIADTLYTNPTADIAVLQRRAATQTTPHIVISLFHLCNIVLRDHLADTESVLSILKLVTAVIEIDAPSLKSAESRAWLGTILKALSKGAPFIIVDALVTALLKASRCNVFDPKLDITGSEVMTTILDSIFRYLRPNTAPYHIRAVELLWDYNQLAEIHTLEIVIARQMAEPTSRIKAFEAFGVLWRLTDDAMLPGETFHIPILMVVDALSSEDVMLRSEAETWMRCNVKSYFRILDPILSRLIKPSRDMDTTRYLLSCIVSLFRFGGQGLSKACQSTDVSKSVHSDLTNLQSSPEESTYLHLLVNLATSVLQAEYPPLRRPGSMQPGILRVQDAAQDLLRILVSEGDCSIQSLVTIRVAIVSRLRSAIRQHAPELQSKLLQLLHNVLTAINQIRPQHKKTGSISSVDKTSSSSKEGFDSSLIQVIVEGVSSPRNRAVLQHWVDFVLVAAPQIQQQRELLLMLCECFSDQLRRVMLQLRAVYSGSSVDDINAGITDAEPVMLLTGLERLLNLVVKVKNKGKAHDLPGTPSESAVAGGSGTGSSILGLVSGVFTVEAPSDSSNLDSVQHLDDAINALLLTWSITNDIGISGPSAQSKAQIYSTTRGRTRVVLERLFKSQPAAIIGSCVQVWAARSSDIDDEAIFDCVDALTPSAQKVVEIVSGSLEGKSRSTQANHATPAMMGFLEMYISRLEAPIAVQIWNTLFGLARDILSASSTPSGKAQLYPVLRCLTVLCRTIATTSALEDRRLRRDLQDVYTKVLDGVVSNATKLPETVAWERDAPMPKAPMPVGDLEKVDAVKEAEGVVQKQFLADSVLTNLRSFLADPDKIAVAAASISYHIVTPAFRQQKANQLILRILVEMTKLPSTAKSWKSPVIEAFNETRFFRIKPDEAASWKPLISALMDNDKERFPELLGRIVAGPSANIFTNREQEMISRSMNLRRLSFILLTADTNHYFTQLPSIQEKLVDILRTNVVSPRVHGEVYLCLRVLMCRIGAQHLTNFWPVIITELLKVFEAAMDDPPADGSEDLQLILAACKFLDLLLVIQSEDFQIHQWMFVTDTTDATYPDEEYQSEAIMDRLSEILSEHAHNHAHQPIDKEIMIESSEHLAGRKPRLAGISTLSSLNQLQPFFSRASIDTFEGVYQNGGVDWEAVEDGLNKELFEGRD